jgi:phage-related protein
MTVREAIIHPKALEVLRGFSKDARKAFEEAIRELQLGRSLSMPLSRPIPSVALGVSELRIQDRHDTCRVFYSVKSSRGIFVFHAFKKKTRKTPKDEIELARKRLKEMLNETR